MTKGLVQVAMFVVLALSCCKSAAAQMVLYDDFSSSVINPAKWVGAPGDPLILDEVRNLASVPGVPKAKQLHLMERAYGTTTDNSGSTGGLFGLSFPNPSAITAVSFTVVVNQITIVACKTNPGMGGTGAEFRGSFFNIDASPTSQDHDVTATISIGENLNSAQEKTPTAIGFVTEGNGTVLSYQVLGDVALKSTNTLSVQWDQPHHQFIFQLNNNAQVFEPYSVSDTSKPFFAFKNIDLARVVPDCTSTPQPDTVLDADFRDVFVNQ